MQTIMIRYRKRTTVDAARTMLRVMIDLGVLPGVGTRWSTRTPNVLTLTHDAPGDVREPRRSPPRRGMVALSDFNQRERQVIRALRASGKALSTAELGRRCFLYRTRTDQAVARTGAQAMSWARNSIRRPLREGFVGRVGTNGSGTYAITRRGRTAPRTPTGGAP